MWYSVVAWSTLAYVQHSIGKKIREEKPMLALSGRRAASCELAPCCADSAKLLVLTADGWITVGSRVEYCSTSYQVQYVSSVREHFYSELNANVVL